MLSKVDYAMASEMAGRAIDRYSNGEIDSVYLVFNEFKSVISQRLIVEQVLPIERVGEVSVAQAEEMTQKERERALEAAKEAGVGIRRRRHARNRRRRRKVCRRSGGLYLRTAARGIISGAAAEVCRHTNFRALLESVAAEHAARMTAMDAATNQRNRYDRFADPGHESRPASENYERDYRDRKRSRRRRIKQLLALGS